MAEYNFFKKLLLNLFDEKSIDPTNFEMNGVSWNENSSESTDINTSKFAKNPYANPNIPFNERAKIVQKRIDECRENLIDLKNK